MGRWGAAFAGSPPIRSIARYHFGPGDYSTLAILPRLAAQRPPPSTQNPNAKPPNPKPHTLTGRRTQRPRSRRSNRSGSGGGYTLHSTPETRNRTPSETRNPTPPKPGTRNTKHETRNTKPYACEQTPAGVQEGRCKATWKREFKLPWREAGPPDHHDDNRLGPLGCQSRNFSLGSRVSRLTTGTWHLGYLTGYHNP